MVYPQNSLSYCSQGSKHSSNRTKGIYIRGEIKHCFRKQHLIASELTNVVERGFLLSFSEAMVVGERD